MEATFGSLRALYDRITNFAGHPRQRRERGLRREVAKVAGRLRWTRFRLPRAAPANPGRTLASSYRGPFEPEDRGGDHAGPLLLRRALCRRCDRHRIDDQLAG